MIRAFAQLKSIYYIYSRFPCLMLPFFLKLKSFAILSVLSLTGVLAAYAQNTTETERLQYARSVLNEGLKNKDSAAIAEGYYLLGKHEVRILNYSEAYRFFYLSLHINEKLNDHYKTGRIYLRLSEVEIEQGNIEKGREYVQQAIDIFEKHKIADGLRSAYHAASVIRSQFDPVDNHHFRMNLNRALQFAREAEKLQASGQTTGEPAGAKFWIGYLYLKSGNPKALNYLEEAVKSVPQYETGTPLLTYSTLLASAYIYFGKTDRAFQVLRHCQQMIDSGLSFSSAVVASHYDTFSSYYQATGDWKNAWIQKETAVKLHLENAKADSKGKVSRWRVQLETEKKDLELKLQKQEIETKQKLINQQQMFTVVAVLLILSLLVTSYFLYVNYKKQRLLSHKNAILVQEQNHRVKNNFQVISSLLNLQSDLLQDEKAKNIFSESRTRIDSMMLLHRQLYEQNHMEMIQMEDLLRDVAASVATTFGIPDFRCEFDIEVKFLRADLARSVGLIVNELMVNSFKHVLKNETSGIKIYTYQKDHNLTLIYKDPGKDDLSGILKDEDKKSFGLHLIDMILFQVNGTLNYRHEDGSVFTITLSNN